MGGLCSGGVDSGPEPAKPSRRSQHSVDSAAQQVQNTDARLIDPSNPIENSGDNQDECETPSKSKDEDIPPRVPDDDICPSRPISPPLHPKLVNRNCNTAASNDRDAPSTPSTTKESSGSEKPEILTIACTGQSYNPSPPSTPREHSPSATEAEAAASPSPLEEREPVEERESVEENESMAKSDLPEPYKEPAPLPEKKKRECSVFLGLGGEGYPYENKQDYLEYREYIIDIVRTKLDKNKISFHNIALHPRKRFAWVNLYDAAKAQEVIKLFHNMEVEANRRGVKTRIMAEMSYNKNRGRNKFQRGRVETPFSWSRGRGDSTQSGQGGDRPQEFPSYSCAEDRPLEFPRYSCSEEAVRVTSRSTWPSEESRGKKTLYRRGRTSGRALKAKRPRRGTGGPTVLYSRYVGANLLDMLNSA